MFNRDEFADWLRAEGGAIVGYAGNPLCCPLSIYAEQILFVNIFTYDKGYMLDGKFYEFEEPWIKQFIEAIDKPYGYDECILAGHRFPVTGKQALEVLNDGG